MSESIHNKRFIELEYVTLREEIKTAKANMFKLVVGGAAIIPADQSLATTCSIGTITLALPLIVIVLVLLFLTENHSMIRAGTYILLQMEPKLNNSIGCQSALYMFQFQRRSTTSNTK